MTSPGMDFWASAPPVPLPVPGAQRATAGAAAAAAPAVVFPAAPPVPVPAAPAPAAAVPPPGPGGFPFAPVTPGEGHVAATALPDVPAPLRALSADAMTGAPADFDEIVAAPAEPVHAAEASRRSLRRRRTIASRVRTGLGEFLITCAVITGLYVVWLVWWTDVKAEEAQDDIVASLEWAESGVPDELTGQEA